MKKLAFNIKKICKEKGIKLSEIAKKMGITSESLSRSINGNPKLSTLIQISKALDVNIKYLFEDEEECELYGIINYHNNTFIIKNIKQYKKLEKILENNLE